MIMKGKTIKAFLRYIAAELLCLFVNIMLAALGKGFFSVICLVCTVSVLICIIADFALKEAAADLKRERSGEKVSSSEPICAAVAVTVIPLISYAVLCISALGGVFEFYGIFKLVNPAFMQLYNFIEPSASSADLSARELAAFLPAAAVPALAFSVPYMLAKKRQNNR